MENEISEKSKEIQKISDEFEKQKKIFEQELNKLDKEKDEKLLKLKEIQNLKKITEDALDYSLVLNMKEILEVPEIQISKLLSNKHLCELENFANVKNLRSLLYKASNHGFTYEDVIKNTKGISPTLVITQVQENGRIFGGFTSCVAWGYTKPPTGKDGYYYDDKSFVFTIEMDKLRIFPVNDPNHAIHQNKVWRGIDFGGGTICILQDGMGDKNGRCNSHCYYKKQNHDIEPYLDTTLAGLQKFHVSECEIYTVQ
jgi:hypothetical protein